MTRLHRARLAGLTAPAGKALELLHGALGGQAPVSVRESTALRAQDGTPERSRRAVLVDFDDGAFTGSGTELTFRSDRTSGMPGETAAQAIAASWVLGEHDLRPLGGTQHAPADQLALAGPVWRELTALPRIQQLGRIRAMRAAALSCASDPLFELAGGDSRRDG
ncbi:hypothetical protein [Streptomyces pyxinae]|uniref:hypothetical protein n=1 Tax=Streptomyces pyxinae TaxID=2970734 RepID=UPI0028681A68|nr:hypothetical protein [Streptomyces sp. LP05-1]